ncbi:MAG: preprotein translocase subunit YajC [Chlamydiota bacterium]
MKNFFYGTAGFSFLMTSSIWADDATQGKEGGLSQTLMILGMALVFFYFILWRPEQKRRKQVEKQRGSMKIGDRVTAMGIVGTLSQIQDSTVVLKMIDGSKIEMLKNCITDVQSSSQDVVVEEVK